MDLTGPATTTFCPAAHFSPLVTGAADAKMGYAGYTPAKLPPTTPTELEAALRAVTNLDSLAIIGTLCKNAAVQPREEKFRKVKLSNKKVAATVVEAPGAMDAMLKLGWARDSTPEDGDVLVLPAGKYLKMDQVRKVEEAKERLEKATKDAARLGKKPSTNDLERERIRAQIEADKKERAVAEPVMQGSVAQQLPAGGGIHQGKY
eukprot:jgi/Tetstr1/437175/TSEL_002747.t2